MSRANVKVDIATVVENTAVLLEKLHTADQKQASEMHRNFQSGALTHLESEFFRYDRKRSKTTALICFWLATSMDAGGSRPRGSRPPLPPAGPSTAADLVWQDFFGEMGARMMMGDFPKFRRSVWLLRVAEAQWTVVARVDDLYCVWQSMTGVYTGHEWFASGRGAVRTAGEMGTWLADWLSEDVERFRRAQLCDAASAERTPVDHVMPRKERANVDFVFAHFSQTFEQRMFKQTK